ncbi:hypothetical protein [Kingella bonacorsii]|nr:hypothetical protein [Kingella bonacorsii]
MGNSLAHQITTNPTLRQPENACLTITPNHISGCLWNGDGSSPNNH